MFKYLFSFKSLTYAQRAQNVLMRNGIFSNVTRLPRTLTNRGCTYGLKVNARDYDKVKYILNKANLSPVKIFIESGNGSFSEVK